ncbi:MAG: amidase [Halobacteriales archaeon]
MSSDLQFASATELAVRIRHGTLSPVELVEACLDRIDVRNDTINAFVYVDADRARREAKAAEAAVERGETLGPLHGLPVAIKDLNDVAGMPTTSGSVPFADNIAEENAPFVDRLIDAGAIMIGKTNTPEYGHKGTTDNQLFGATSTPFAPGYNAGGSSGGSAAAVSDGMVPLAQGTDGGGSVRIPASFCGGFGFKSTYRRIPRKYRPDGFSHTPFSHVGPQTRTVEDAALMLSVMTGIHPSDPFVTADEGTDFLDAVHTPIDELDIAYSPDMGVFPIDNRVADIVDSAVDAFTEAGADLAEIEFDPGRSRQEIVESWLAGFRVGYAKLAKTVKDTEGVDYLGEARDDASPEFIEQVEAGQEYSAVEFKLEDIVRTDVFDTIQSVLDTHDLLVTPTLAVPPVENDSDGDTVGPTEVNGEPVDPVIGWCLTYPLNMTGHPAATVPAGFTDGGLPIGMQLIGRRYDDETVLAASAAFERVHPWHDAYPPS